jgi:hypothetical protein
MYVKHRTAVGTIVVSELDYKGQDAVTRGATRAAEANLAAAMEAPDLVACPFCERYQPSMLLQWKRKRAKAARIIGITITVVLSLVSACLWAATRDTIWLTFGLVGACATWGALCIWYLVRGAPRLSPGRPTTARLGLRPEDYEVLLEQRHAQEDAKQREQQALLASDAPAVEDAVVQLLGSGGGDPSATWIELHQDMHAAQRDRNIAVQREKRLIVALRVATGVGAALGMILNEIAAGLIKEGPLIRIAIVVILSTLAATFVHYYAIGTIYGRKPTYIYVPGDTRFKVPRYPRDNPWPVILIGGRRRGGGSAVACVWHPCSRATRSHKRVRDCCAPCRMADFPLKRTERSWRHIDKKPR